MNILTLFSMFPLGVLGGIAQVLALSHLGLIALLLFPVIVYLSAGLLFYIDFVLDNDDMSLLSLPIITFLWGYVIAVNPENLIALCFKKEDLKASK